MPGYKKILDERFKHNPFTHLIQVAYLCKTHFNQIMGIGKHEDERQLKLVGFE